MPTPLHHAAAYGHTKVAVVLLAAGAALDALNDEKRKPLHSAA